MLIFIPGVVFVFNSAYLMTLINIKSSVALSVQWFCVKMIPGMFICSITTLLKSVLNSQNIINPFFTINMATVAVFIVLSTISIRFFYLDLNGFLFAFYIKQIIELHLVLYYIKKEIGFDYFMLTSFYDVFEGLWSEFCFVIFASYGSYAEIFFFELNSVFAGLTGDLDALIAWSLTVNFTTVFFYFAVGSTVPLRTLGSINIGLRNPVKLKETIRMCFFYGFTFISVLSFLIYIFRSEIAFLITHHEDIQPIIKDNLSVYSLIVILEFLNANLSTLMKMIGYEKVQFIIGGVFISILRGVFGYWFCVRMKLNDFGLIMSYLLCEFIFFITLQQAYLYYKPNFFMQMDLVENDNKNHSTLYELPLPTSYKSNPD